VAVDLDYTGRTFAPSEPYEVSRIEIANFADAVGEPGPLCRDRAAAQAAGYPDVIAPPTFAIVVTAAATRIMMSDPGLGVNHAMVVHGEQSFTHSRPLRAGDVVVAQSTIESIRQVRNITTLTTVTEVRTVGGSTSARRGPPSSSAADRGTMAVPGYDDIQAGTGIGPRKYHVTRRALVKYAGAFGDFNPIHWNERIARSVGLPDVIARGMLRLCDSPAGA
jgi:acyl dehydratase